MTTPQPADGCTLTDDALEAELCALASRIAAAESRFLDLVAELDGRGSWASWGLRSAAHWLSWRCGMRLGAARERVRVARSLQRLPVVHAAFAAGELSYCKVRALTRVATPATEQQLVELATVATGAQLERIVRSWHSVLATEYSAARVVRRGVSRRYDVDGSVVLTVRLPPEEAAVVEAAIAAARAWADGAAPDADGVDAAAEGVSAETPEEARLAQAVGEGDAASRASADAVVLLAEHFLAAPPGAEPALKPETTRVLVHVDLDAVRQAPTAGGAHIDGGAALAPVTVERLLCEAAAQLVVRGRSGEVLDLGRTARHATPRQRLALLVRDGGCRFPGCTRRSRLIPHHVAFWSHGGRTDLDNLVLVCQAHHRAVHELGYRVAAGDAGRFTFLTPDGRRIPDDGGLTRPRHLCTADPLPDVDAGSVVPTWAGEPLDLPYLVSVLAGNALLAAGHVPAETPAAELPTRLRTAVGWPLSA